MRDHCLNCLLVLALSTLITYIGDMHTTSYQENMTHFSNYTLQNEISVTKLYNLSVIIFLGAHILHGGLPTPVREKWQECTTKGIIHE